MVMGFSSAALATVFGATDLEKREQMITICGFQPGTDPTIVVNQIFKKPESERTQQEVQLTDCWWSVFQQQARESIFG